MAGQPGFFGSNEQLNALSAAGDSESHDIKLELVE